VLLLFTVFRDAIHMEAPAVGRHWLATGCTRPTTVGDYIEITAMKRTFVRVCPGATPRPLRLYATQRMA
jgi:hypothetical protein